MNKTAQLYICIIIPRYWKKVHNRCKTWHTDIAII